MNARAARKRKLVVRLRCFANKSRRNGRSSVTASAKKLPLLSAAGSRLHLRVLRRGLGYPGVRPAFRPADANGPRARTAVAHLHFYLGRNSRRDIFGPFCGVSEVNSWESRRGGRRGVIIAAAVDVRVSLSLCFWAGIAGGCGIRQRFGLFLYDASEVKNY